MIPSWARKGAKVVCVRGVFIRTKGAEGLPEPVVRRCYTLSGDFREGRDGVFCKLVELHPDSYFRIDMFRPVTPSKTLAEDVALIKSHLRAPRSRATVRARSGVDA